MIRWLLYDDIGDGYKRLLWVWEEKQRKEISDFAGFVLIFLLWAGLGRDNPLSIQHLCSMYVFISLQDMCSLMGVFLQCNNM